MATSYFKEEKVLITGAASGIGKIMARRALEHGAEVILWDIDLKNLEVVQSQFTALGPCYIYQVDLVDHEHILRAAENTLEDHTRIDIIINNAGIIVGQYFMDHKPADIHRTIHINALAPMYVAAAFLPGMVAHGSGHICTIASSGGLVANPKMSVYAASKWALLGWAESVRLEMEKKKLNIKFTTILPYYINTGMFDGVKSKIPLLEPEKAAAAIMEAIAQQKTVVSLPSYIYHLTRLAQGILPVRAFDWVAGKVLGIYTTMDDFKGRQMF